MMMAKDRRVVLAEGFSAAFKTAKRTNGDEFVTLRDGAPEWMTDLCHEAHGDMFPDDRRYDMIRHAADELTERDPDEWEDAAHEIADGMVSVYCAERNAWLASHLSRQGYCDDALSEFGPSESIDALLGWGWYLEAREIVDVVRCGIESRASESEDDDES